MNVTVRNVITSMRLMSAFDWAEFFESVSLVDETLRADSDFGAMDFATRDRYRHAIEELARGSRRSELEVARRGDRAAASAAARRARRRSAAREDPGYYLISRRAARSSSRSSASASRRGDGSLRAYVAARDARATSATHRGRHRAAPRAAAPRRARLRHDRAGLALPARRSSRSSRPRISRSRSSTARVTALLGPRPLPRLELRDGVPAEPAHAGRRADAAHRARPRSRSRSSGSRSTTSPTPTASSASRCSRTGPTRRPRRCRGTTDSSRRRATGSRASTRATGPRRTAATRFLLLHRRRRLERARGQVDGLGAQAREAARAEPPAARRDRHDVPRGRRAAARRARRRPLRDHARRRHPAAARRRARGWSARWPTRSTGPRFDPRTAASSRATPCSSRGSRRRCPTEREGSLFQRVFSGPGRHRSLRRPRSPTSTRISSARAPTPARASTTSTRSRPRSRAACPRTRC